MTHEFIALVTFAFVSTVSPGGATSLATVSGAQFGFLRSIPLIGGISAALALLVAISGTGLSASILANPRLETGVKAVGSIYLLWLAFGILRAGPPKKVGFSKKSPVGFAGGAILLLLNPKAWAMAVGVAGSFSSIAYNPYTLAAIFGCVFALAASLSLSIWALVGASLVRLIRADWQWHLFNLIAASLLVLSIASFWF